MKLVRQPSFPRTASYFAVFTRTPSSLRTSDTPAAGVTAGLGGGFVPGFGGGSFGGPAAGDGRIVDEAQGDGEADAGQHQYADGDRDDDQPREPTRDASDFGRLRRDFAACGRRLAALFMVAGGAAITSVRASLRVFICSCGAWRRPPDDGGLTGAGVGVLGDGVRGST